VNDDVTGSSLREGLKQSPLQTAHLLHMSEPSKKLIKKPNDALLLIERGERDEQPVNVFPVKTWNTRGLIKFAKILCREKVEEKAKVDLARVVVREVRRIYRPKRPIHKMRLTDAAFSSNDNRWPRCKGFVMTSDNAVRSIDRYWSRSSILRWQRGTVIKSANFFERSRRRWRNPLH
jgi:hypothetical protein